MARTIAEIKAQMTKAFIEDETVREKYQIAEGDTFASKFSSISIESILFFIFASCAWAIEKLIDTHKVEITELINAEMPHTLTWYQAKAKAYRHGQSLITDTDEYDNTGLSDEDIENRKVVKYSAVTENDGGIILKVATRNGEELAPLAEDQLNGFKAYMAAIKDAGVPITFVSAQPDLLDLTLVVRVDASVIDSSGVSVLEGNEIIKETIEAYLQNLPFNGELILASLVDALQLVEGVKVPHVSLAKVSQIESGGYSTPVAVDISAIPYSGYFKLNTLNLTIE